MAYDGPLVLDYLTRTHKTSLLTDREKHLIGLAVTITRGCQVCTRGRIEKARAAGMDDSLLNALVDIVSSSTPGSLRPRRGRPSAWPTPPRLKRAGRFAHRSAAARGEIIHGAKA